MMNRRKFLGGTAAAVAALAVAPNILAEEPAMQDLKVEVAYHEWAPLEDGPSPKPQLLRRMWRPIRWPDIKRDMLVRFEDEPGKVYVTVSNSFIKTIDYSKGTSVTRIGSKPTRPTRVWAVNLEPIPDGWEARLPECPDEEA